ncbi:MAG: hypothetical protein HFI62_14105 [Lachnospiraceae bacterium]|nr:hypothetical protein [Lachnospiraceae bacterium]
MDKPADMIKLQEYHFAHLPVWIRYLDGFYCGIINSDILGYAFEPEERFENPDGSPIIFDTDYLGEHCGTAAVPGPFASAKIAGKIIW